MAVSAPPPSAPTKAQIQASKKRVIVDEFDYSAVMTSVQAVFGTQQNIGKGIRAMLVKRIAEGAVGVSVGGPNDIAAAKEALAAAKSA